MDKYMTTGISKEHPQDFTKISQASVIADNDRNLLTKSAAILNRWTKYCNNLCNYFNWSQSLQNDPSTWWGRLIVHLCSLANAGVLFAP
ncbi:hypothetical protein DPMN_003330 [Dreissena polymorpha]|uniref:Uncharacterized protein n=1 Tax=Dreissena polymorpha TaxID=45954 RepID=A0A9D4MKR3_DREPO|nr:hypothetical protein DPMN_003330 [Dreissena polymorpha]